MNTSPQSNFLKYFYQKLENLFNFLQQQQNNNFTLTVKKIKEVKFLTNRTNLHLIGLCPMPLGSSNFWEKVSEHRNGPFAHSEASFSTQIGYNSYMLNYPNFWHLIFTSWFSKTLSLAVEILTQELSAQEMIIIIKFMSSGKFLGLYKFTQGF